jgi:hypothetical protein
LAFAVGFLSHFPFSLVQEDLNEDNFTTDLSVPVSLKDLDGEYEQGLLAMQSEQSRVMLEQGRKQKRRAPKPGCYPVGFSTFKMTKNQCSLSLHEVRDDISTLRSAIAATCTSVYFDEAMPSMSASSSSHFQKSQPRQEGAVGRYVRRKISQGKYLSPRNAAEERRQLQAVLQLSILEQALPLKSTNQKCQRRVLDSIKHNLHQGRISSLGCVIPKA